MPSRACASQHREVGLDPRVLGPARKACLPHVARADAVAREVVGESERGLGVDEIGSRVDHILERLARFQRPARLEHQTRHAIAEIVEAGAELERAGVLLDGFAQRTRFRIRVAQLGVLVGELGGDRGGSPSAEGETLAAARRNDSSASAARPISLRISP